MNLPAKLKREFEAKCGAAPVAAARALYDIDGNLGETYLAADATRLALYSRRAGAAMVARYLDFQELSHFEIGEDGTFVHLKLRPGPGKAVIQLQFSPWHRPPLEQIAALWIQATGRTLGGLAETEEQEPELTPLVAFCASLHAMISSDEHIDQNELLLLSRAVHDPPTVAQGIDYLNRHGLERLLASLAALLAPAQKRCLLANLIAVGMEDGEWRGSEQELVERFRAALGLSDQESRAMSQVLLMKYSLGLLARDQATQTGPAELTPLRAFCASLHAMIHCDGLAAMEEIEYQSRILPDPERWADGAMYAAKHGVDPLLSQLDGLLEQDQKQCLISHLLAVAMVDGRLRSREQELLDRFQQALHMPAGEYAAIYEVLLAKNNLQVFA